MENKEPSFHELKSILIGNCLLNITKIQEQSLICRNVHNYIKPVITDDVGPKYS